MKNEVNKLCRILKELDKVKDKMNPEIFEEIRIKLAEGSLYKASFQIVLEENRKWKLKNRRRKDDNVFPDKIQKKKLLKVRINNK